MHFSTEVRHNQQPIGTVSSVQQHPLGTIIRGVDGLLGEGEFIYLQGVASCLAADLVSYDPFTGLTTRAAATANSGLPLAVATAPLALGEYGWFQISGTMTVANNATAAAGPAFQKATAQIGSAAVAGTQILGGARILTSNGSTFSKTVQTRSGSDLLFVPDFDAIFVGCPISGTGIQASTFIGQGVDDSVDATATPGGRRGGYVKLTTSDLSTSRPATADGSVTGTFTRTNFSLMSGQRIFAQGQIT